MDGFGRLVIKLVRYRRDLGLLAEAAIGLVLAGAAIRLLPFRRILHLASIKASSPVICPETREQIGLRVRWAVNACASRMPWHPLCFPQGLAAQWMLRRRGVTSTFFYGVMVVGEDIEAHVWVCDGDTPIIGGRAPEGMRVLVQAPIGSSS
nr:lasso peptide biosynthesis B2 protein [uncultured Rhodoferax sp.]